jgi:hypothetical protein
MLHLLRRAILGLLTAGLAACAASTGGPTTAADAKGIDAECRSLAVGNSPGINPPRFLRGEQPGPPSGGATSGYACVRVTITTSGDVVEPMVVKTDNQEFAQAFVRALSGWKYEPATRGTARVPYHTLLVARFPHD